MEHLQSIQLTRKDLERFHTKDFFEKLAVHFFVRYSSVRDKQQVFRASEIIEVKRKGKRSYTFANRTTQMSLVVKYGDFTREIAMEYVSNTKVNADEFDRWKRTTEKAKGNIPSSGVVTLKKDHLFQMATHKIDEKEIKARIEADIKKGIYVNPTGRKIELELLLREITDLDERKELEEELERVVAIIDRQHNALLETDEVKSISKINKRRKPNISRKKVPDKKTRQLVIL